MAKLGEYVTIRTGKLDANAATENGKYPFFTCSVTPLRIDNFSYDCECVLVAGNGDLNVKYYNGKFDAYQRTYIIESKDKTLLTVPYLYCFLEKYIETLRKQSIGGIIKYIKLGNLTNAEIPLCGINKQKQIITVLSKLNSVIEIRKKQLLKLDELVKSRFIEMFGDPVLNTKKWNVEKLKNLSIKITSGNTPKGGSSVYVDEGIMFFRSQNVWKNNLVLNDIAYIDEKTHKKMNETSLKHGDILITKTGRINTENSSLGRAALFLGEDGTANINGHVYLVRLSPDVQINKQFILHILTSDIYRELIRRVCVGGIDKRQLNRNHIEEFPIIMPPIELQEEFELFVQHTDKSKLAIEKSIEKLEILKKSLMQEYFG